jgi:hypothetical protein
LSRRALLLSLAALAALPVLPACNKGSAGPTFRLAEPSSITVARAFGTRHGGDPWPYAFVANTAHDELIQLDAVDDSVVSAPIVLRPMSIPVYAPRPALVTSAEFHPPAPATAGEDNRRPSLVVVVSAGSSQLQLIRTWKTGSKTLLEAGLAGDAPVDLAPDTHSQVLALLAAPAVDAEGKVVDDRVRVIAALDDGRLAVVEYQWNGTPAEPAVDAPVANRPSVAAGPEYLDLGFQALSLATDPSLDTTVTPPSLKDPRSLFAATLAPIPPSNALGVAQIDMAGAVGGWTVNALDAGGPTRLVAALTLQERKPDASGAYDQLSTPDGPADNSAFQADPVQRVYAWREPSSCGPTTALPCGIVVLDTTTRQLAAPAFLEGQAPFPITVPSRPIALIAARPPLHPLPATDTAPQTTETATFMRIHAANSRVTTGVLGIPCEDGRIYFADLARWEVPSTDYEVNSSTTATGVSRLTPSLTTSRRIGFYEPANLAAGTQRNGWTADISAADYIQTTPGFTPSDTWTVTYQGYLPAFATSRVADVKDAGGGQLRVAFQAHTPGSTALSQVVNVYDPTYGVRVGDVVEIWTGTTPFDEALSTDPRIKVRICPDTTTTADDGEYYAPIEGRIVAVEPPSPPDFPGGSLLIAQPADDCVSILDGRTTRCDDQTHGPWRSRPNCWAALPTLQAGSAPAGSLQVRIRGGGGSPGKEEFVVVGAATGYAGRAIAVPGADIAASLPLALPLAAPTSFVLSSADEADGALVAACSLLSTPPVPCADEQCRAACERVTIARRARRTHLTSVACHAPSGSTHCELFYPQFVRPATTDPFPPPTGPTLAFTIGLQCKQVPITAATGCTPAQNVGSANNVIRDAQVVFTTRSGWVPAVRFGGGGNGGSATQPTGGVYFDRTGDTEAEAARWDRQGQRYRFLVPYVDNVVLDVSPGQTNGETKVLR